MSAASLAVAVATLDRPAGLARCLAAIAGGERLPAEVVVVDQGGPATAEGVASAIAAAARRLPLRHVRQPRRGLAAARNLGAAETTAPLLAVTDDDCVPDRGWVAALERAMAAPDAPAAVTGRVLPLGPPEAGWAVSSRTGEVAAEFVRGALPWRVGTGGNFAVRREWLERVGGYDERLGAGTAGGAGEDMDMLHRLLRAGARIRYEPAALVLHERQSVERRRASRSTYGRGMGACCGLWLRRRDGSAVGVLASWAAMRLGRLGRAVRTADWRFAGEELLVLRGTAAGLLYGLRGGGASR